MIEMADRQTIWRERLKACRERVQKTPLLIVEGRLTRMVGLTMEAVGVQAAVGERCLIHDSLGRTIEAEVVGFSGDSTYLMPTEEVSGVVPNARVTPTGRVSHVAVSRELLGRVLGGNGEPLDGKGPLKSEQSVSLTGRSINPLARDPVRTPLDVGVRVINGLLTVGQGQRMGLFAGSGVGKSVLLGMMTRFTKADVIVVGLIGERGREVKEFVENILGEEGMARAVVIAVPADQSPLKRLNGAMLTTSIAEYFRDQGLQVLMLMDSLTRYAQAQREIALAIGEPPVTKGYPPSVFAKLPALVERAGTGGVGGGAITAFYTVLTEGDDQQDPIADSARAILDGHIVLSRKIAETGQYPAVDIEASISRIMTEIVTPEHQKQALRFKQIYSTYQQNQDLINVGAYTKGSDVRIDESIVFQPRLRSFLEQGVHDSVDYEESKQSLHALIKSSESKQMSDHEKV